MPIMFEKLEDEPEANDFADEFASIIEGLSRSHGFLVEPSNRAALSIATNFAAEMADSPKPDRRNSFTIACGSSLESVSLSKNGQRGRSFIQDPASIDINCEICQLN